MRVAALLEGFDRPWFVAGAWAIDLFLGRVTRPHGDVDIAVFRADQHALRSYLRGWRFEKAVAGRPEPWAEDEELSLPVHELHVRRDVGEPAHVEVLLTESSGTDWQFRRNPAITRPIQQIRLYFESGVPYLSPEIVLLYKAKHLTKNDDFDFENARPSLGDERRRWLRNALVACHPGHRWLARL